MGCICRSIEDTESIRAQCSDRTSTQGDARDRCRIHREEWYRTWGTVSAEMQRRPVVYILALVGEPVVRCSRNTLPLVRRHQLIEILHPHGTTNNLTNTGHQAINTLGNAGILEILLHVEGLDLHRELGKEDGLVNLVGHETLSGLGNIITELMGLAILVGDAVLVEPDNCVGIAHTHEGTLGGLELVKLGLLSFLRGALLLLLVGLLVEVLDVLTDLGVVPDMVDGAADHLLKMCEEVIESDEGKLGLNVGVFAEMAASERLLGAERLLDTEDVAQRRETCLEVELGRLCEVCLGIIVSPMWELCESEVTNLLAVVVELKERGAALNLSLDHAGRSDFEQTELLVTPAETAGNSGADFQGSTRGVTTDDKMSVVKLGLVVGIVRNNVGDGLLSTRGLSDDLVVIYNQLVTTRGVSLSRNGLDDSVESERGLVGKGHSIVGLGEIVRENALEEAGAITETDEDHVLLRAQAVNPTGDSHTGTTGLGGLLDLDLLRLGLAGILGQDDSLSRLQLRITGSLLLGLLRSKLESLGLLLCKGLVGVDDLLDSGLRNRLPLGAGLLGGASHGLASFIFDRGVGLDVGGVGGEEGLVGELFGAGGLWGVDSRILVNVDDCRLISHLL